MAKSVMQALAIMSLKDPNIEKMFNIPPYVHNEVKAFLMEAKPYIKDRYELRKNLKENWLGSYMYYYYCENNEPAPGASRGNLFTCLLVYSSTCLLVY